MKAWDRVDTIILSSLLSPRRERATMAALLRMEAAMAMEDSALLLGPEVQASKVQCHLVLVQALSRQASLPLRRGTRQRPQASAAHALVPHHPALARLVHSIPLRRRACRRRPRATTPLLPPATRPLHPATRRRLRRSPLRRQRTALPHRRILEPHRRTTVRPRRGSALRRQRTARRVHSSTRAAIGVPQRLQHRLPLAQPARHTLPLVRLATRNTRPRHRGTLLPRQVRPRRPTLIRGGRRQVQHIRPRKSPVVIVVVVRQKEHLLTPTQISKTVEDHGRHRSAPRDLKCKQRFLALLCTKAVFASRMADLVTTAAPVCRTCSPPLLHGRSRREVRVYAASL
jgi:hypothetical protein